MITPKTAPHPSPKLAPALAYSPNGELSQKTETGADGVIQTTHYTYDVLGSLKAVELSNGTLIEYLVDGMGRRIGKKINGILATEWLWDRSAIVAELDGSGNIVSRFMPGTMVKSNVLYRIERDHLGSPRLIINASTGEITQQMDFDEWGNIILDTNPGFQPLGFVSGFYDLDTNLVRFGVRDYIPEIGRWTSKDPIRFKSGDDNFYGYVAQNPINMIDPSGLLGDSPGQCCERVKDELDRVRVTIRTNPNCRIFFTNILHAPGSFDFLNENSPPYANTATMKNDGEYMCSKDPDTIHIGSDSCALFMGKQRRHKILHELAHYVDCKYNNNQYGGEEGVDAEEICFGCSIDVRANLKCN